MRVFLRILVITGVLLAGAAAALPRLLAARLAGDAARRQRILGDMLAAGAERLGPVFVKVAQMLSYRADLFPEALLRPLARLQDRVRPLRPGETRRAVERSLGAPVATAFAAFDEEPIACGSVAVVCRAVTPGGIPVAVKIVRPGAARRIARDVACLRGLLALAARCGLARGVPVLETFDMIAALVAAQTDMEAERRNLAALRATLDECPGVAVPAARGEIATPDVLVMDLVEGAVPLTAAELPDRTFRKAAEAILQALYRMMFVGGVVHCDLHPGNLLVGADGRVALVDAGLVATLDAADRRCFRDFFLALAFNDAAGCAGAILASAAAVPERLDRAAFRRDVAALLGAVHGRRAGDFLVADFVHRVFEIERRHGIVGAPGFTSAIWALVMFEGLVRKRYPDLDFQAAARPFLAGAIVERIRRSA